MAPVEQPTKEELKYDDVYAGFSCEGRLIQIGEVGHGDVYLEIDEAKALRDWLNKVLPSWDETEWKKTFEKGAIFP